MIASVVINFSVESDDLRLILSRAAPLVQRRARKQAVDSAGDRLLTRAVLYRRHDLVILLALHTIFIIKELLDETITSRRIHGEDGTEQRRGLRQRARDQTQPRHRFRVPSGHRFLLPDAVERAGLRGRARALAS